MSQNGKRRSGWLRDKFILAADPKQTDAYAFDVDGLIERLDNKLHKESDVAICEHANAKPWLRKKAKLWVGADRPFETKDLSVVFPKIIGEIYKREKDKENLPSLEKYYRKIYCVDDYAKIAENRRLVEGILRLEENGARVLFYTNGLRWNVRKILKQVGFDDAFIERSKQNMYDVIDGVRDGYVKPSREGFQKFLNRFGIEDPKRVAFFDDGIKNMAEPVKLGVQCFQVWTTHEFRTKGNIEKAEKLGIPCLSSAAHAVETIADFRKKLSLPGMKK
ncbi:MAG: HAD family hydrolase [Pseudomonadota bacterium]